MNTTYAIVIEDKKKASEKGLIKKLYAAIAKRFRPQRRVWDIIVESRVNTGDAVVIDLGADKYYRFERKFYDYLDTKNYLKSAKAFSVANEKTLLLMRDWDIISRLLDIIDPLEDDNKTVIKLRISKPKPRFVAQRVKYVTADPVYIYRDYVRVGFDAFKRHFDPFTGDSYVKVDGKKFYIDIDRNGKEYLSE